MNVSRRKWIAGAAIGLAAAESSAMGLPAKSEFPVTKIETCLNNARWHPISVGATKAVQQYLEYKAGGGGANPEYSTEAQALVKRRFADLIHARPSEISYVPSTTVGENLIGASLELGRHGGNVVTDALHFEGSLYQYVELAKQALETRIARPHDDMRIALADLDRLIDSKTKLVAVSLVSMINGFQHDLKAVCELAHSRGALVYVDAVQAVGAVPVDIRATGVDFLACSSYKWLMGDMGLGFLYVREDLLERMRRVQYGFRQLERVEYHAFPYDSPGDRVMDWKASEDAGGHFEVGTISNTTVACLSYSLDWIGRVGIENIAAHRKPLMRKLQQEIPRLGFEPMTPADSTSPIVAFAFGDKIDRARLVRKLKDARVDIAVYEHRIRISPSVYNDAADVDRLLEALS
jgi:selenocysteine lyase/cysteine desulfurase